MSAIDVITIEQQALRLDRNARGHLASVLLRSLDGDDAEPQLNEDELERVWAVELERRSKEWDANPTIGLPHEEVMQRARELLK